MFTHSEIDQPFCIDVPLSLVSKELSATEVIILILLVHGR